MTRSVNSLQTGSHYPLPQNTHLWFFMNIL